MDLVLIADEINQVVNILDIWVCSSMRTILVEIDIKQNTTGNILKPA